MGNEAKAEGKVKSKRSTRDKKQMDMNDDKTEMKKNNTVTIKNMSTKKYCICRTVYDENKFYIECEVCFEWYHGECVGIEEDKQPKNFWCNDSDKKLNHKRAEEMIKQHAEEVKQMRKNMQESELRYYKEKECHNKKESENKKDMMKIKEDLKMVERGEKMAKKEHELVLIEKINMQRKICK